jgi:hypothetical protein
MKPWAILFAVLAVGAATAFGSSILSPIQELQATPPREVPWLVRLYDRSHSEIGTLRLRITPHTAVLALANSEIAVI